MKSAIPPILALCFVLAYAVSGCGQRPSSLSGDTKRDVGAPNIPSAVEGWETYEDAYLRFLHPSNRRASGPREAVSKMPRRSYIVMGVDDKDPIPGPEAIFISEVRDSSGRSLREVVAANLKSGAKEQEKLVGSLQSVMLKGGRCIHYQQEGYTSSESNQPIMRMLSLRAECETGNGNRIKVISLTEAYPEAGRPSARALEQVKVFERLVKSIEFK